MHDPLEWWLLIYRVPTDPARKRTYVWRKLKKLGAIYLQQAAALLPDRPELKEELDDLARRIMEFEGEAALLKTTSSSPEWEQDVIRRFNHQRNEEYAEVEETAQRLAGELARETRGGKFTFAELEENEEGLESLRRWSDQVKRRDHFRASGGAAAEARLQQAASDLEEFSRKVYEAADQ